MDLSPQLEELQDDIQCKGATIAELQADVDTLSCALPMLPTFCGHCHARVCIYVPVGNRVTCMLQIMRDPDGFFCCIGLSYAADTEEAMRLYQSERYRERGGRSSSSNAARRIKLERYVSEFRPLYNRCATPRSTSRRTHLFWLM